LITLLVTPPALPRLLVIWVPRVNDLPLAEVSVTVWAPAEGALCTMLPVVMAALVVLS